MTARDIDGLSWADFVAYINWSDSWLEAKSEYAKAGVSW